MHKARPLTRHGSLNQRASKQGVPVAYASRWHFVSHMICENALTLTQHKNPFEQFLVKGQRIINVVREIE